MEPLSEEAANEVWDLLVEMGGAPKRDDPRTHFVSCQTGEGIREWRFQGLFGYGGKFYRDHNKWRVGHYREDDSPERNKIRDEINAKLDELYLKHTGKEAGSW
jgi:hypothetical protein